MRGLVSWIQCDDKILRPVSPQRIESLLEAFAKEYESTKCNLVFHHLVVLTLELEKFDSCVFFKEPFRLIILILLSPKFFVLTFDNLFDGAFFFLFKSCFHLTYFPLSNGIDTGCNSVCLAMKLLNGISKALKLCSALTANKSLS